MAGTGIKQPLVEVATVTPDGTVPLGIMNAEQALSLPYDINVVVPHPGRSSIRIAGPIIAGPAG